MNAQKKAVFQEQRNNQIPIHFLDNDFYRINDEILTVDLKSLSHKARSIPTPLLYGKFLNDAHYMKTLDLVLSSTMETKHREIFFFEKVLPKIMQKNTLLDVGPGNGGLASVAEQFKQITLVDTCNIALNKTEKNILHSKKSAEIIKIHQDILTTNLPEDYYNMIMISHVLYYIDSSKWAEVAELCYNALRPNGVMVIVLSGAKLGKAELMRHFSGKSIDIDFYIQDCINRFACLIEVFRSTEYFYACDLSTMLHIAGFLLYDINTYTTKNKLIDYVTAHHQVNKDLFKLSTQQEFILIRKQLI